MSILFKGNLKEGDYKLIKTTNGWVLDGEMAYVGVERQQGKWIDYRQYNIPLFDCSICWYHAKKKSNFCPNCGAYMRGVNDEDL